MSSAPEWIVPTTTPATNSDPVEMGVRMLGPRTQGAGRMVVPASSGARKTAHEYVRDSLRTAILNGSVPGGSRLVQADVARDLEVSTTPVREALRDLATEGLIRLDPHRGAIVHSLSFEETREIHLICRLLEPEAMSQAAKVVTNETLAAGQALIYAMESETDPGRWADLNRQFHGVLIRDIDSKYLLDLLRKLRDTSAMYVGLAARNRPLHMEDGNRDHPLFLEVLRSGDSEAAAELSRRHLNLTISALESSHYLFDSPIPSGSEQ